MFLLGLIKQLVEIIKEVAEGIRLRFPQLRQFQQASPSNFLFFFGPFFFFVGIRHDPHEIFAPGSLIDHDRQRR